MPGPWDQRFAYIAWANERCENSIGTAADPTEALRLYGHILAAEHLWLARILDQAPTVDVWPQLTLEQANQLRQQNLQAFASLPVDEAGLARVVSYKTTKGVPHTNRVADILLHLVTHGGYHRGQVARAVKLGGGEPIDTDYITWCRLS